MQVDGSSVVDDNDLLVITSDSETDDCHSPPGNTPDVSAMNDILDIPHLPATGGIPAAEAGPGPSSADDVGDEIPDVWDGFDEGCAAALVYKQDQDVSPTQVGDGSKCLFQ